MVSLKNLDLGILQILKQCFHCTNCPDRGRSVTPPGGVGIKKIQHGGYSRNTRGKSSTAPAQLKLIKEVQPHLKLKRLFVEPPPPVGVYINISETSRELFQQFMKKSTKSILALSRGLPITKWYSLLKNHHRRPKLSV